MSTEHETAARPSTGQIQQLSRPGFSFRRVLAVAGRIISQFVRDRRSLGLLFLAPLLVMTILNIVLNSTTTNVKLGIVAPDVVYSQIQTNLKDQNGLVVKQVAADKIDSTLKNGDADGVLTFPDDFIAQLQSGQTPTLTLRLEGSNPTAAKQLRGLASLIAAALARPAGGVPGGGTAPASAPTVTASYLYGGPEYTQTDAMAPIFVGLFAFFFVFLLTSISFLRERSLGTIERLVVSPLSRTELVLGYVGGFLFFALAQSAIILLYVVYVLQVHYKGNLGLLFLVTAALTIGGVNMGIFISAFARNELQVVQFIPLLLVPQALLGGLFWPVNALPVVLKQIAYVLPLTYANFALKDVMLKGFGLDQVWPELTILLGFAALMIVLAALSLRQEHM